MIFNLDAFTTVKMTSLKLFGPIMLVTIVSVQCLPQDITTSRYNEETIPYHDPYTIPLLQKINFSTVTQESELPSLHKIETSSSRNVIQFTFNDAVVDQRSMNFGDDFTNFPLVTLNEPRKLKSGIKYSARYSNFIRNYDATKKHDNHKMQNTLSNSIKNHLDLINNSVNVNKPKFSAQSSTKRYENFQTITLNSKPTQRAPTNTNGYTNFKNVTVNSQSTKSPFNSSTKTYKYFTSSTIRNVQTLRPSEKSKTTYKFVNSSSKNRFSDKNTNGLNENLSSVTEPNTFKIKLQSSSWTSVNHKTTPPPRRIITVTNKPIILTLTKVPYINKKSTKATARPAQTVRTPGWISKIKSTTPYTPTTLKHVQKNTPKYGWPNNKITNKQDLINYKNYTKINIPPPVTSRLPGSKTTVKPNKKFISKLGQKPTIEQIKQNWYEAGVPYPNPMPEINSNTPTFSQPSSDLIGPPFNDLESIAVEAADELPVPQSESNPIGNAVSVFDLDMKPAETDLKDVGGASGCPTVHISSSVLSPQQRQECSDLNLVINSHFHQNTASDRTPTVDTYQAGEPEDAIPVEAIEEPAEAADAGDLAADPGFADAPQSDVGGGSLGSGGTGGTGASGGSGGNGGDGDDGGGLGMPDLKGLLHAIDWVGNKLGYFLGFLRNPYLYLIPALLFFLVGFVLVIALFPWWVPLLFLIVGIKAKQKPNIVHHKHVHKAVHHPDGWFWNHQTKTWENLQDYLHRKRIDHANVGHIPQAIDNFGKKYGFETVTHGFKKYK